MEHIEDDVIDEDDDYEVEFVARSPNNLLEANVSGAYFFPFKNNSQQINSITTTPYLHLFTITSNDKVFKHRHVC